MIGTSAPGYEVAPKSQKNQQRVKTSANFASTCAKRVDGAVGVEIGSRETFRRIWTCDRAAGQRKVGTRHSNKDSSTCRVREDEIIDAITGYVDSFKLRGVRCNPTQFPIEQRFFTTGKKQPFGARGRKVFQWRLQRFRDTDLQTREGRYRGVPPQKKFARTQSSPAGNQI